MRIALAAFALSLGLASALAGAQDRGRLPDIGSSAATLLAPAQQREYGKMVLAQLRYYEYTLEDPLLGAWLQSVGDRLANSSDKPQRFTFFWLRDRQINAFATLGGYIGVNAGLVLAAEDEGEMASVLSHEIAHVTQQHVLRAAERAQKDSIPVLLAMLGAIAVAQSAGGNSSDDAAMAALASAQGLLVQRQIDYTRSNESEADRIGIRTLDRAGYDPNAAAAMFQRMQSAFRSNQGGERERTPDYLQTHPVTTTRIAEAKQRAAELGKGTMIASTSTPEGGTVSERVPRPGSPVAIANAVGGSGNPLLPAGLRIEALAARGDSGQFPFAKERLRVLSADTPDAAIREYERLRRAGPLTEAQRYGLALAKLRDGHGTAAVAELAPLLEARPGDLWLSLAMAQAEARAGKPAAADARLRALLDRMPHNRAVALTWAEILAERNTPEAGRLGQDILRPLLASSADDPVFQATFARINEIAGDPVRAGEAYAELAYLNGRPEQALVQLNTLKKRPDLDYYARARIDARIAAITPMVLELRRQGVRDEDLERD